MQTGDTIYVRVCRMHAGTLATRWETCQARIIAKPYHDVYTLVTPRGEYLSADPSNCYATREQAESAGVSC